MSIQVTACLNPFSTERSEFTFEQEISVSGIIKKLDALHAVNTGWRVLIDDEIVTDFSRVPKDGQHVYVKLVPEGDNQSTGTGMKIGGGALVALGVVVGVLTHWTGVGAFAGAAMVGAGIGLLSGGVVLYSTDIPSLTNKNRETPEQDPSIRGSQNQMRPYGVVPTLFGKRRIYTDLASKSYTWVEDGSMYLYQLFCVGQKDMMIDKDSIKIDETLLTDYSSTGNINSILAGNDPLIDMRIHQDGTMPVLYDKCVHEDQVNAILKNKTEEGIDGSVIRTTPDGTQEINVDIFFYNGLGKYSNDGNLGETSVTIGAWYKKAEENDSEYKPLGKFKKDGLHPVAWLFSVVLPKSLKASSENIWAFYSNWNKLNGPDQLPNPGFKKYYGLSVYSTTNNEFGWTKTVRFVVNDLAGVTTNAETEITGAELKTKRYSIHLTSLEAASYTIKLSRLSDDSSDSKVIDDVYVGSIRAVKNENPVRPERASQLTIVELKIKASEKLNQVVKQLNFIAESKLPVYLGYGTGTLQWRYAQSRNPASAAIYAMQGEVAQQKLSDSEIDWPAFEKLYTWCVAHQYECNAYITESISISGLLSAIASTCRAEIVRLNGKITVIQDIERDSFVQIFTPRNSHDYSENIALGDVPDALNLNFVDSDAGFAQGQARIYNTPNGNYAGEPETTQDVELWGVTNSEQARKLGMYKYAVTNHRALIHRFSVDFEYLMCTKGDWIKYAGDIALAGITQGRTTEIILGTNGEILGFECDEALPMESGKSYAVRIRKNSGESVLLDVQNTADTSKKFLFAEPISQSGAPKAGDLFVFGERGNEAIDLIITDIQCGENLSAELVCVEYSPEIFGVDNPDFVLPDFENKISAVTGIVDAGAVGNWRTWTTFNDSSDTPSRPTGSGTSNGWHYTQTSESKWISTKTSEKVSTGTWSEPMPTGQFALEKILNGETTIGNPDIITNLVAMAHRDGIQIGWAPLSSNGLKNTVKFYTVEISKNGGETWEKLVDAASASASYSFDRNSDGYPEASAFSSWRFHVKAENVYGNRSEQWSETEVSTSIYGTWIPSVPNFTLKEADEGGINLAWSIAKGRSNKELYGTNTYRITVKYGSAERTVIETDARTAVYNFNRATDKYPEKPTVTGAEITLDKYRVSLEVVNESGNRVQSTEKPIDYDTYKTWIPRSLEGDYAVRASASKRTATLLFPPQNAEVYGTVIFGVTISRRKTDIDNDTQIFYTPNITKDCYEDINSYKDGTTTPVFLSGSFKQNLPLLGQDMRSIQLDRYDVDFRDGEPVKNGNDEVEQYASSREYYVYDDEGIQSFRDIYGIHSGINIDAILEGLENGTVSVEWVREGGSESDYTKCYMTLSLIPTPMPDDTEYIYKVIAKNIYGNAVSAAQDINILATAQSAADLVDKAITANKLDDQSVTTEKIAAGAITADEIAAVNLLAKGATAGNMTAEGLQVPNSGFWAGKTMRYDYTDPKNVERTYTAEAGEFFVGNNPNHESNPTEDDEYLHFIPRTKQFFLAIKNIVFQSLATIIKGVFRVKNSLADADKDAFLTVNPTNAESSGTPAKTAKVNGTVKALKVLLNDQSAIEFKDKSFNGYKMHDVQTNALYVESRESTSGDSGGIAITNDGVTAFGAGDTDGVLRVVNEDNVGAGAVFKVMKNGSVNTKGTVSAPAFAGNLVGNASSATRAETSSKANKLNITGMGEDGFTFHQTDDNFHGASGGAHYLISNHGDGESYYNFILRLPFWGIPQYQRQTGSPNNRTSWFDFITSENIHNQIVARANEATNSLMLRGRTVGGGIDNIPYIVDQKFDSSSGYLKLSNGLLVQWGISSISPLKIISYTSANSFVCLVSSHRYSSSTAHDDEHYRITAADTLEKYNTLQMSYLCIGF